MTFLFKSLASLWMRCFGFGGFTFDALASF